jgi:hypothetical protein
MQRQAKSLGKRNSAEIDMTQANVALPTSVLFIWPSLYIALRVEAGPRGVMDDEQAYFYLQELCLVRDTWGGMSGVYWDATVGAGM